MSKLPRLLLWLCRKFTRSDLHEFVEQLQLVLAGREPEILPQCFHK